LAIFDAKRNTKKQNAEHVYRTMPQGFTLSASVTYQPLRETYEQAAVRVVEALTDENLADYVQQRKQEQQDREQAVADPQTIEQFRLCLRDRDYRELTPEQQHRFDRLLADQSRSARRERRQSTTVTEIQSEGRLGKRNANDPVQVAEAKLIGMKLPGFFPTPRPVISRMLELAEIKDGVL
jgi:hypothetical protein